MPNYAGDIPKTQAILVGTLSECAEIGGFHPSRWDAKDQIQMVRITVKVELILQADPHVRKMLQEQTSTKGEMPIYYFHSQNRWPPHISLGMQDHGGHWHLGDRLMFFLQAEKGHFRTLSDQWSFCVPTVYTGAHPGYSPNMKDVTTSIIDILLTRGKNATDDQMIQAIDKFRLYEFNAPYAVQTLKKLSTQETPKVEKAAGQELADRLESNCVRPPGWTVGTWADPCEGYKSKAKVVPGFAESVLRSFEKR